MSDETELYVDFATTRSESAFAAVVKLHVQMVFATALRQLGDRGLAEEITQNVFLTLANEAGRLKWDRTLAGWLYRTTLNQSRQRLRAELRRQKRETMAAELARETREGASTWAALGPMLDEALLELRESDRLAVILHFMEGRPFREVGQALGVGEDAARKRVNGVLETLLGWFRNRGFASSSGSLAAALGLETSAAASVALVPGIVSAYAALPVAAGSTSALGLLYLMSSTQAKFAVAAFVLALGLATSYVIQSRRHGRPVTTAHPLEGASLSAGQSLEASPPPNSAPQFQRLSQARGPAAKSFMERINEGDMTLTMLSPEAADAFIQRNKGTAESLLAAYRVTHDLAYLRRAATNFPGDPSVLFRVVAHDAFPENRRHWIEEFNKADPDNALGAYWAAQQHFKDKETAAAVEQLAEAGERPSFRDYVTEHMQALEEIYLANGRSPAEAKALGMSAVELPHLPAMGEMSKEIADLVAQYRNNGDDASAQSMARAGLQLADRIRMIQDGGNVLGESLSLAMEDRILGQLDPARTYDFIEGDVPARLASNAARQSAIREDSRFIEGWFSQASETEIVSYFDRLKLYGETAAVSWLKNRTLP